VDSEAEPQRIPLHTKRRMMPILNMQVPMMLCGNMDTTSWGSLFEISEKRKFPH
jgi:hypothetical protein